jgi:hypothetical protein
MVMDSPGFLVNIAGTAARLGSSYRAFFCARAIIPSTRHGRSPIGGD